MNLWLPIVVVVVVALVLVALRSRRSGGSPLVVVDRPGADYTREREDTRVGTMSAEDREWEAASLRRDATRREDAGSR